MVVGHSKKPRCFANNNFIVDDNDNAPCHLNLSSDDGLIKVMFLPPRSTPILQPMDIGIISPLKSSYMNKVSEKVVHGSIDTDLKNLTLD